MNGDQTVVLLVLAATMALFIRGSWRYDIVALLALLAAAMLASAGLGREWQ